MLKRLQLKNFMSWRALDLEFDQIVSLVGTSNNGKTNVLRALRMVLLAENWPESAVHDGQSHSVVDLTFADGRRIQREWKKGKSHWTLTDCAGKKTQYEGVRGMATELAKFTGVQPITVDELTGPEQYNFMDVDDEPLFVKGRDETVQRRMAGLTGTNELEVVRDKLDTRRKSCTSVLAGLQGQLTGLKTLLKTNQEDFQALQQTAQDIDSCYETWKNVNDQIDQLDSELNKARHKRELLGVKAVAEADCWGLKSVMSRVQDYYAQYTAVCEQYSREQQRQRLLQTWASNKAHVELARTKLKDLETELGLHELEARLEESPEVCPSCGRPV